MMGKLLLRGMLIGILAGILAFGVARVFGEPPVARAIALEEETGGGHSHDHGAMSTAPDAGDTAMAAAAEEPEEEIVTRPTQAGIGLLTGNVVYSVALGGILALVFASVHGRFGATPPRVTVAWIALAGFVALVLVPALKYPPNPPAVGDPETIGYRTELFFLMVAFSVVGMILATALARGLADRHGAFGAGVIGALAYVLMMAVVAFVMPVNNEVTGSGFPADTLWDFRVASFGIRATVFAVLGIGFGIAAERALLPARRPAFA